MHVSSYGELIQAMSQNFTAGIGKSTLLHRSSILVSVRQRFVTCTPFHLYLGFFQPGRKMFFIDDGQSYLTVLSKDEPGTGTWKQVALVSSTVC